jgi:hypothetical protein
MRSDAAGFIVVDEPILAPNLLDELNRGGIGPSEVPGRIDRDSRLDLERLNTTLGFEVLELAGVKRAWHGGGKASVVFRIKEGFALSLALTDNFARISALRMPANCSLPKTSVPSTPLRSKNHAGS